MPTYSDRSHAAAIFGPKLEVDLGSQAHNQAGVNIFQGRNEKLQVGRQPDCRRPFVIVVAFDALSVTDRSELIGNQRADLVARRGVVPANSERVGTACDLRHIATDTKAKEPGQRAGIVVGNAGPTEGAPTALSVVRVNHQVLVEVPKK